MTDRIDAIKAMLQKDPTDIFLHYSLGMEYVSSNRLEQAIEAFQQCVKQDAGYVPAYVELGKCLCAAGRLQTAREFFEKGLELARAKGLSHTADYILQQLQTLPKSGS